MTKYVVRETVGQLSAGLYEVIKTETLANLLNAELELKPTFKEIADEVSPNVLAHHVSDVVRCILTPADPSSRVTLANEVLRALNVEDRISEGPAELQSLQHPGALGRPQPGRPTTRLSDSALLTNGKDDLNLANGLRLELESADSVDLLCAFVRWTGLRILQPALERCLGFQMHR